MIVKRLMGLATASAFGKAWEKKSRKWLSLAGALVLFQVLESRASRKASPKKASK
jgi:hypothetical protein